MDKILKISGAIAGGLLLVGASFAAGAVLNPVEKEVVVTHTEILEVPTPFPVEKIVEVEVEKIKEIIKNVTIEVSVLDTDKAKLFCDRLLFEDVSECLEEVQAEEDALNIAINEIEKEFADSLEDEDIIADEDEVKIVKIYKDFEDLEILESNFDDKEYEFKIKVKIDDEDTDEKKYVYFTVSVEDSEAKILNIE